MKLVRVVHQTSRTNPLNAYSAFGRFHLTLEEARVTSYLSFSKETCVAEVGHHLGGVVKLRDRLAIEFEVEVDSLVDLTSKHEQKRLRVTPEELVADPDHTITQQLARRLRREKVQALIVPSARDPHGKNVVLFLENIDKKKAIRKIREVKIE